MRHLLSIITLLFVAVPLHAQDADETRESQNKVFELLEKQQILMKILNIANDKTLTKDLELLEDQVDELKRIGRDFQRVFSDQELQGKAMKAQRHYSDGDNAAGKKLMQEYQTEMHSRSDEHLEQLNAILLPHQFKRIKQIARQQTLQYQSGFRDEFGIPYAVADRIGLDKDEKKKLKEATREAREEYYKELEKLKRKTHEKILEAVPREKREEIREIVGEWYSEKK